MAAVEDKERAELQRRSERFRGDHPPISLEGRVAVIVDDGIATGSTARAACQVARAKGASRVVLGSSRRGHWPRTRSSPRTPTRCYASKRPCRTSPSVRDTVTSRRPRMTRWPPWSTAPLPRFGAAAKAGNGDPPLRDEEIQVTAGQVSVAGHLAIPQRAKGVVVFAHGSGSSRHSPRNRYVAEVLNNAGFATVLFDLLTPEEEGNRANVFDIALLASRLVLRHGLAGRPARHRVVAGRLLRRQYRCRRSPGKPRTPVSRSQRWCPAAGGPILREIRCARCTLRPCYRLEDATSWSSSSTGRLGQRSLPSARSPWCLAPPICSRNRARSSKWPCSARDWFIDHLAHSG